MNWSGANLTNWYPLQPMKLDRILMYLYCLRPQLLPCILPLKESESSSSQGSVSFIQLNKDRQLKKGWHSIKLNDFTPWNCDSNIMLTNHCRKTPSSTDQYESFFVVAGQPTASTTEVDRPPKVAFTSRYQSCCTEHSSAAKTRYPRWWIVRQTWSGNDADFWACRTFRPVPSIASSGII